MGVVDSRADDRLTERPVSSTTAWSEISVNVDTSHRKTISAYPSSIRSAFAPGGLISTQPFWTVAPFTTCHASRMTLHTLSTPPLLITNEWILFPLTAEAKQVRLGDGLGQLDYSATICSLFHASSTSKLQELVETDEEFPEINEPVALFGFQRLSLKKRSEATIDTTLLFPRTKTHVLLAHKKKKLGAGLLNGMGGKVEAGETVQEAAIRETQEEIAVTPTSITEHGAIRFLFPEKAGTGFNQHMYIFVAESWEGTPEETEEMAPEWIALDDLPFDRMWSDDFYWLPSVIRDNRSIEGTIQMCEDHTMDWMYLSLTD